MSEKTFVTFVLDETGSMQSIKDDTIGGFNAYLEQLKQADGEIVFTLIKFDSNRHDVVYAAEPLDKVEPLDDYSYQPGAATPLIDACVKAIKATEAKVAEDGVAQVAVTVQTDGYENASVEFKNEDLVRLIKEKTAEGWLFTFIGAGIDAFDQAGRLGFVAANTMSYDRDKSHAAFCGVAMSTTRYATSGAVGQAAFTPSERMAAGEDELLGRLSNATAKKPIVDDVSI
jgi:hypothetical protein